MGILVDGKWIDDEKDRYHGKRGSLNTLIPRSDIR